MTSDGGVKRVLVLGATGVFGRRLVQRLAGMAELDLIITSRRQDRADALVARLRSTAAARITALAFDHHENLESTLATLKPWAVIDASGPFQGSDYRIARAVLEAGAHVIDLADATDYLLGYADAVAPLAKSKGLVALAGASSTPALSVAVVDHLVVGWRRVDAIDMAITPDGHNDVGASAVAGVISYAGVLIDQFRHGKMRHVPGWLESEVFAVPGVGRRRVAPVETIDAQMMQSRYRVTSRVTFSAGLESPLEQWGVQRLASLQHRGMIKNLSRLVPWLVRGRSVTRLFGGKTGGMVVRVRGLNGAGIWTESQWSLLAKNGDGPNVPALPAVAALHLLLDGKLSTGARVASGDVPLANIAAEFTDLAITTHIESKSVARSVFEQAVAQEDYGQLPEPIRHFHSAVGEPVWAGRARVVRGCNFISQMIGSIIGLPTAGDDIPVRVSVERNTDRTERWTRSFNGKEFHSDMAFMPENGLTEQFGPFRFQLGVTASPSGTTLPVARGWAFGVPLPRLLLPVSEAHETVDAERRFQFRVAITLPFVGLLVRYSGWLKPAS